MLGLDIHLGGDRIGATHVCLRKVEAAAIFENISRHSVTHMCGAPIVLGMLINAPEGCRSRVWDKVTVAIAGAAPPSAIIEGTEKLGFQVQHVYGLTEVYGPSATCEIQPDWPALRYHHPRPADGAPGRAGHHAGGPHRAGQARRARGGGWQDIGELAFKGNVVMKGYLKNPRATEEAFRDGWFLTGDLGVLHPDGYIEIKDRSKDIIISGGENISSLEVEEVLYRHPAVREAAVIAAPDEKWGEVPLAVIALKDGASVTEVELTAFCRQHLAGFKIPKTYAFGELPKTSTGKVQKHLLRKTYSS